MSDILKDAETVAAIPFDDRYDEESDFCWLEPHEVKPIERLASFATDLDASVTPEVWKAVERLLKVRKVRQFADYLEIYGQHDDEAILNLIGDDRYAFTKAVLPIIAKLREGTDGNNA